MAEIVNTSTHQSQPEPYSESWYLNIWIPKYYTPYHAMAQMRFDKNNQVTQFIDEKTKKGCIFKDSYTHKEHTDNSIGAVCVESENSIHIFTDPTTSRLLKDKSYLKVPDMWLYYDIMSGVPHTRHEHLVNNGAPDRDDRSSTSIGKYSLGSKYFYESHFHVIVIITRHNDDEGGFSCIVRNCVRTPYAHKMLYYEDRRTRDYAYHKEFKKILSEWTPLQEEDLFHIMETVYPNKDTGTLCLGFGLKS